MKLFGLVFLLSAASSFGQTPRMSNEDLTRLEMRMTSYEKSTSILDSLFQDYKLNGNTFLEYPKDCMNCTELLSYIYNGYVKLGNQYPNKKECSSKVKEVHEQITKETRVQTELQYSKLIAKADEMFDKKEFLHAQDYYKRAIVIKPSDEYPKERLLEINKTLTAIDESDKMVKFNYLISEGDKYFEAKEYGIAKMQYLEAIFIKSDVQYPKDQIARINDSLNLPKEENFEYENVISKANYCFSNKQYAQAKTYLQQAIEFKPNDTYALNRITEIDAILKSYDEAAKNKAAYSALIKKADGLFLEKKYDEARVAYEEANAVDPSGTYPNKQIAVIDLKLIDLGCQDDKEFAKVVEAGDKCFKKGDFEKAKLYYTRAVKFQPDNKKIQKKLSKTEARIAEKK